MAKLLRYFLLLVCGPLGASAGLYMVQHTASPLGPAAEDESAVVLTSHETAAELGPVVRASANDAELIAPVTATPQPPLTQQQLSDAIQSGDAAAMLPQLLKLLETTQNQNTGAEPHVINGELLEQLKTTTTQTVETETVVPELPAPNLPEQEPAVNNRIAPTLESNGDQLSITIQNSDLREVLSLLSEHGGLNILASPSVTGQVSAVLKDVTLDSALDAILRSTGYKARREGEFIYVGTTKDFEELDISLSKVSTRIYRPNYVTAAELQTLITPVLSKDVGRSSVTSAAQSGIGSDGNDVGGDSLAASDALLVSDYETVLDQVDQIVLDIDKRPLQVGIEAMILAVRLTDGVEFGVNWQFLRNKNHLRFGIGNPTTQPFEGGGETPEFKFESGGVTFAFLDSNLGSFISALEEIGDTNVIATPRLMCLNKQRAEILIGAELGYISTTVTETSTAQNVEFLEVGAQLRLRPFIATDGMIRMEIRPELSTGTVRVVEGFTLPDKDVTQVTTNIMVRDGCTVVIGGLMREDITVSVSQVPVLGSLPGVGFLFRQRDETIERREILVLVTPRIICEPDMCIAGSEQQADFLDRNRVYKDHLSPLSKRYIGRKYVTAAEEALAQGDITRARHLIERAVNIDPTNPEAVRLERQFREPHQRLDISLGDAPVETIIDPEILEEFEPESRIRHMDANPGTPEIEAIPSPQEPTEIQFRENNY